MFVAGENVLNKRVDKRLSGYQSGNINSLFWIEIYMQYLGKITC